VHNLGRLTQHLNKVRLSSDRTLIRDPGRLLGPSFDVLSFRNKLQLGVDQVVVASSWRVYNVAKGRCEQEADMKLGFLE